MQFEDSSLVSKPLDISIIYWASGVTSSSSYVPSSSMNIKDANKSKQCEVHPALPHVLSCDRRQVISIWDYSKREIIMQHHISEIFTQSSLSQKTFSKIPSHQISLNVSFLLMQNKSFLSSNSKSSQKSQDSSQSLANIGEIIKVKFADNISVSYLSGSM